MPDTNPSTFDQPTTSPKSARFFSMPSQYRHGKDVKMVEPAKEQRQATVQVLPQAPVKPQPMPSKQTSKKQTHHALVIVVVIVLFGLIVAGYMIFRSVQKQSLPEPASVQSQPVVPAQRPVETINIEPPAPTQPAQETESPFSNDVEPGKDSDSDGLTDTEENLVYQTNPNLPDTDADGFLDGNEVFHRYNPNGTAPGTLSEAGLVKLLTFGQVQMAYPAVWQTNETENGFSLRTTTNEAIFLVQQANPQPLAWLQVQGGQENVVKTKSKSNLDLYLTKDKQQALLMLEGIALEFSYDVGTKSTLDYLQTFQMIINSVEVKTEL